MVANFVDLSGFRVLVTGASGDIGFAVAKLASGLGASCALWGRNERKLNLVKSELVGTNHHWMKVDLSHLESIEDAMDQAGAKLGGIDAIVHAAGILSPSPLRVITPGETEELLRTNLTSALFVAKSFRRKSVPKQHASLTLISSVVAMSGQPGMSAYSASKGGLISLTQSLALELAVDQIRVNSVSPGAIEGEMMNKLLQSTKTNQGLTGQVEKVLSLGKPEDVANAVIFLLSRRAKWINGTNLVVDGGSSA